MIRRAALLFALAVSLAVPASAQADFGIEPGSLTFGFEDRDGQPVTQAGAHPFAFNLHFKLNAELSGKTEGGELRDTITDLPPGLFGDPQAVPSCPMSSFEGALPACAAGTQVGVLRVVLPNTEAFGPIYNLSPSPGMAAQLGFTAQGFTALLSASVDPGNGYAIHIEAPNAPVEARAVTAKIWGSPADPDHNPERGPSGGLTSEAPLLPFLTLPTSCVSPPRLSVAVSSKLAPEVFVSKEAELRDAGDNPQSLSGCEMVPFSPSVQAGPSTTAAESPSGLGFRLNLPNQELLNTKEGAVTETEPESTEVVFPAGLIPNPSSLSGQGVCTLAQYEAASASNPGCPTNSKLGTLLANTPLLQEPIEGSVYLAAPHENPFDSLLALYIVASAPQRGVFVKQAGLVIPDEQTGQLTSLFKGLPPIPYSSFEVRLREGARAPLITPQLCGNYTTTVRLRSFARPNAVVERTAPFTIGSGANGGNCAGSEAGLPNHPLLQAGTTVPIAGAYSPFVFELSREDGQQRFSSLEATLPEGLVGKLAGIPYCTDAQIAAAAARSGEGEGALEAASPSCPAASRVGSVTAAAGAGPTPYEVPGSAYLAGPYKGAPLSVAIITPAIAGPFDLGAVVVRSGLYVDESSAKVTVKSDPIPSILHGLPLDVRSATVRTDRQGFILNPTSCEEKAITAKLTSLAGSVATLANRFQAGSCNGLGFKPRLSLALRGKTNRGAFPALRATFAPRAGDANLRGLSLTLPRSEFIEQGHFRTICTRVQFNAGQGHGSQCPAGSIYGQVTATTPLLDAPLEGPIYLRSSDATLPDAVFALHGQVDAVAVAHIDSLKGRLRARVTDAPDVPLSRVVVDMQGGKKGLFVNSTDLCKGTHRASVSFSAQNGRRFESEPALKVKCGGKSKKQKRRH